MKVRFIYINLVVALLWTCRIHGQSDSLAFTGLELSGFNNSTSLFGFFKLPIHPGVRIAGTWNVDKNKRQFPVIDVNGGYYFQAYAHHGIQLYGTVNYICIPEKKFLLIPGIGLGSMVTIPDVDVWKLNENGDYENISGIRVQLTTHVQCKLGYRAPNQWSVFLMPQFWLHMPYVNSYVPVLPNSSIHLGISIPAKILLKK